MKKLVSMMLALCMLLSVCAFAAAEETITMGVIGPMTGPAASYGNSVANGAKLAAEEINALGGLQINLLVEDDEHDPEKAVNAFNKQWDDGAQMIVGAVTTAPCVAVAAEAYDARMFMLTPSASSPDVTADNDNVYQLCFIDPAMGVDAAKYIAEKKLAAKVGVIYNNADAYSTGIYQAFEKQAKADGLDVVAVSTFSDDSNADFSVQIAEMKSNGAELVFLPIYYTPASNILIAAKSADYAPMWFGVDGTDGLLNIEGFDKSLAEGVMLLTVFNAAAQDEQTVNFVTKYQAAYNATPDQFAADGYDCVYVLYQAALDLGLTGDMEPEEICEKLIAYFPTASYSGVTGEMTWSESGEVAKNPAVVKIENGVYVTLN